MGRVPKSTLVVVRDLLFHKMNSQGHPLGHINLELLLQTFLKPRDVEVTPNEDYI